MRRLATMVGARSALTRRASCTRDLFALAKSPMGGVALAAAYNSRPMFRRLGLRGVLPVRAAVPVGPWTATVHVKDAFELSLLLEMLHDEAYRPSQPLDPAVIVDLGSNVGFSVLFFRALYPRAIIHAVEADPEMCARLRANTRDLPRIVVHQAAIAAHSGKISFFRNTHHALSSGIGRRLPAQERIVVPALSLDDLLSKIGADRIDLLKFDIEGAEHEVFSASHWLDRIDHLIGEVHPDLMASTEAEFLALFSGYAHHVRERMGDRSVVEIWRE